MRFTINLQKETYIKARIKLIKNGIIVDDIYT